MGGKDFKDRMLASVESLNGKRKQLLSLPKIPQAVLLCAPAVVAYSRRVIVLVADMRRTRICQWGSLSDLSEVRSIGAAVTLNDFIYVVGGVECTYLKYDPTSDNWTKLSQLHARVKAMPQQWRLIS